MSVQYIISVIVTITVIVATVTINVTVNYACHILYHLNVCDVVTETSWESIEVGSSTTLICCGC